MDELDELDELNEQAIARGGLRDLIQEMRPGTSVELENEIFAIAEKWAERRATYELAKAAILIKRSNTAGKRN